MDSMAGDIRELMLGQPSRSIHGRRKIFSTESQKKVHQGSGFRRIERVAIRRHISAALQHLTSDLVFRHASRNGVQCRATQAAKSAQ
jgi:hypothetical protein